MKRYGQPELVLELVEEVHHLRLDGHVERRHGLVEHQELRVERQRAGNADALPLAARELVREAVRMLRAQADRSQQALHLAATLLAAVEAVDTERLGDDLANRHPGVQRRIRVLEDDLDVARTGRICFRLNARDVRALEDDLAFRRLRELDDRAAERRLAAARLADDAERLTPQDAEVHPVHRAHLADRVLEDAGLDREPLDEVLDAEDLVRIGLRCGDSRRRPAPERSRSRASSRRGGCHSLRRELFREVAGGDVVAEVTQLGNLRAAARAPLGQRVQRGWNAQPGGGLIMLGGWPGIGSRRSWSESSRARLFMRPSVYGCRGSSKSA